MSIHWGRSQLRALTVLLFYATACQVHAQAQAATSPVSVYGYRIVNTYPHDPQAFTQGLIWQDGFLYESTGINGHSSVRKVRLEDGKVLEQRPVDKTYFAEGLTDWGSHLLQLTWTTERGFIYDKTSLEPKATFSYKGEGWGLTHDDSHLMLSNGSSTIKLLDPQTYAETGSIDVHIQGKRLVYLNELEYVDGEIFANVWQTDMIARISPQTGEVTGLIDLRRLLDPALKTSRDAVLNGIAWDNTGRRLFVTGKLWPKLFEIELIRNK
jgi:glutamine cyclotransferase